MEEEVKYNIILADPPWTYRDKCHSGERGAGYKYKLMTFSELCALRPFIDSIAADDCLPTLAITGASNALGGLGMVAVLIMMAGTGLVVARRREAARIQG